VDVSQRTTGAVAAPEEGELGRRVREQQPDELAPGESGGPEDADPRSFHGE
jgi:hypothetical protein